jgi:hypothetical protein
MTTRNVFTEDERPPLTDAELAESQREHDAEFLDELYELRAKSRFTATEINERFGGSMGERRMFERNPDPKLSEIRRYLLAIGAYVQHEVIENP